jgi:S-adenosylmethionine/arginine decarboxylase-like enzyme
MSKAEHNAIKYLNQHVYALDKEFGFKMPQRKQELQAYTNRLRSLFEDAIHIAGVNKVIGHEFDFKPESTSKNTNSENGKGE